MVAHYRNSLPMENHTGPRATATGTQGQKVTRGVVLVVDDSPTICRVVTSVLEKGGYRVIVASDGLEALAAMNETQPGLILLDITMPRLDGYQLAKIIKKNSDTKHIPIVMLTGKDGFIDKAKGRLAGAVDYITKPFKHSVLLDTVAKHLK